MCKIRAETISTSPFCVWWYPWRARLIQAKFWVCSSATTFVLFFLRTSSEKYARFETLRLSSWASYFDVRERKKGRPCEEIRELRKFFREKWSPFATKDFLLFLKNPSLNSGVTNLVIFDNSKIWLLFEKEYDRLWNAKKPVEKVATEVRPGHKINLLCNCTFCFLVNLANSTKRKCYLD